jgi:hypothetical protein
MCYFLLYRSAETYELDGDSMIKLLVDARGNNRRLGVTGLLIHRHGHFMQYLEGDHEQVHALYNVIARDTRHTDIKVLGHGQQQTRLFPRWKMAYAEAPMLESGVSPLDGVQSDLQAIEALGNMDQANPVVAAMNGFLDSRTP